jgi:hypothetical protein
MVDQFLEVLHEPDSQVGSNGEVEGEHKWPPLLDVVLVRHQPLYLFLCDSRLLLALPPPSRWPAVFEGTLRGILFGQRLAITIVGSCCELPLQDSFCSSPFSYMSYHFFHYEL